MRVDEKVFPLKCRLFQSLTIFGTDQFIFFSFFKKTDFIFDFLIKLSFGLFFLNLTNEYSKFVPMLI